MTDETVNRRAVQDFPESLMLRDTKLHDDLGGGGQRIFTTAGSGYEKVKYIRADLVSSSNAQAVAWQRRYTKAEAGNMEWHFIGKPLFDQAARLKDKTPWCAYWELRALCVCSGGAKEAS